MTAALTEMRYANDKEVMMAETSEARKPAETGDRNQPEARDRGRLHSVADQAGQEARQSGEKSAEALRRTAEATADATRRTAERLLMQRDVRPTRAMTWLSGLRAIAGVQRPLADAGLEQSRRLVETTAHVTDVYRQAAERADVDVRALFDSWTSVGRGLQEWQRAYFDLFQRRWEVLKTSAGILPSATRQWSLPKSSGISTWNSCATR